MTEDREAIARAVALETLHWTDNPALVDAADRLLADDLNNRAGYLSAYMAGRFIDAFSAAKKALSSLPISTGCDRERVEAVARAIFEDRHRGLSNCLTWDDNWEDGEHHRERYLRDARAAINAMSLIPPPSGGVEG
jgi:hypothetical protein